MEIKNKYIKIESLNINLIIEKHKFMEIFKKIKIFNRNGIFLTGISNKIELETLKNHEYLGQYGHIISINLCKNNNKIEKDTYSVFVNYEKSLEASIAINCLNNFSFKNKKLKSSYSTNKICYKFIINGSCDKENCHFYHEKITKKNSIIKMLKYNNSKIMEILSEKSKEILIMNLKELITHLLKNKNQTIFPNKNYLMTDFLSNYYQKLSTKIYTLNIDSDRQVKNYFNTLKKFFKK